jgi:hypothetical protein
MDDLQIVIIFTLDAEGGELFPWNFGFGMAGRLVGLIGFVFPRGQFVSGGVAGGCEFRGGFVSLK